MPNCPYCNSNRRVHLVNTGEKLGETAGGAIAGGSGTVLGSSSGAAVGTLLFPIIGTALGAAIGGVVGYFSGKEAGKAVGHVVDKIRDLYHCDNCDKDFYGDESKD